MSENEVIQVELGRNGQKMATIAYEDTYFVFEFHKPVSTEDGTEEIFRFKFNPKRMSSTGTSDVFFNHSGRERTLRLRYVADDPYNRNSNKVRVKFYAGKSVLNE